MFNIGDVVVYGIQGICKISAIEVKQVGKTALDYYVLRPIYNQNTALFVPVDNQVLVAKMKDVFTKGQINELIKSIADMNVIQCSNDNAKRDLYKEILASGDRYKLASLIKTIYSEKTARDAVGKKLNIFDEQTLYKAEQILFNEIAFVLETEPQEARKMIVF